MLVLLLAYPEPIVPHPTWDVVDSTKAKAFLECPRRYFYRYVLGWGHEDPSIHLEFGSAWHLAMEHMFLNLHRKDKETAVVKEAFDLLLQHYRKFWDESWDSENAPKDPGNALLALVKYASTQWRQDAREMEVMFTEVGGVVPVSDDHSVYFKIDVVAKTRDGIACIDHKTTGSDRASWYTQFDLCIQFSTYIHALYCMLDESKHEDIFGLLVNGAILRKKGNLFPRLEIRKTPEQLLQFLWNITHIMNRIQWNFNRLAEAKESDTVMQAFPLNECSCSNWGRTCEYHPFCTSWTNPLRRCKDVQPGYVKKFWDPRAQNDDAKYLVVDGEVVKQEKENASKPLT